MPSIKLAIEKGSQFASFEGPEAPKADSMTIDHANGNPLHDFTRAALKFGFVTEAEFDRAVDPAKMVKPYVATGR